MKGLVASAFLIGASVASVPHQQQVLRHDSQESHTRPVPFEYLKHKFGSVSKGLHNALDELAQLWPEDLLSNSLPPPKKHSRRPDSEWDHIIRGSDVQSVWVENVNGEKERDVEGKLEAYDLRTKLVDPSVLGVDPNVTQFSGYLDNNENDKHLFYCMYRRKLEQLQALTRTHRVLRVTQRPRT